MQSNPPINTIPLQQFIQQVKIADMSQQKEVKLDIKTAKQLIAHGIYISANNKKISLSSFSTIKFQLIGSAHNQFEYFIKQKQSCKTIMLSPIFYNDKYSQNQILNPIKFNLMSLNWKTKICALGGISNENIRRLKITKARSIGIKSWVYKK